MAPPVDSKEFRHIVFIAVVSYLQPDPFPHDVVRLQVGFDDVDLVFYDLHVEDLGLVRQIQFQFLGAKGCVSSHQHTAVVELIRLLESDVEVVHDEEVIFLVEEEIIESRRRNSHTCFIGWEVYIFMVDENNFFCFEVCIGIPSNDEDRWIIF